MSQQNKFTLETLGIHHMSPGIFLVGSDVTNRKLREESCKELLASMITSHKEYYGLDEIPGPDKSILNFEKYEEGNSVKEYLLGIIAQLQFLRNNELQNVPYIYIKDLGPIFNEIAFPMPAWRRLDKVLKELNTVAIMETDFTPEIIYPPRASYMVSILKEPSDKEHQAHVIWYEEPFKIPEPLATRRWTSYLQVPDDAELVRDPRYYQQMPSKVPVVSTDEDKVPLEAPKVTHLTLIEGIPGKKSLLPVDWIDIVIYFDSIIKDPEKLLPFMDLTDGRSTYRFKFPGKTTLEDANRIGSLYLLSGWEETSVEMESDEQGQREYYLVLSAHPSD